MISTAWAQGAAPPSPAGGGLQTLFMFSIFAVIFYFMLIRPQMKRQKEHKQMVEGLAKDDEVVSNGGLLGKVTQVGENFIAVEVAKGVEIKLQKHMVAQVMPKGTIKGA